MYKVSKDFVNEIKSMSYEELAIKFKIEDEEEEGMEKLSNFAPYICGINRFIRSD